MLEIRLRRTEASGGGGGFPRPLRERIKVRGKIKAIVSPSLLSLPSRERR